MGDKSYLKSQIRLVSLSSYDLFTPEEYDVYMRICDARNEINTLEGNLLENERRKELLTQKKRDKNTLTAMIAKHKGVPRTVRLDSIVRCQKEEVMPPGVTWKNMKFSKKIAEFSSELSRAMGLGHLDWTLDLIVIRWKSPDILEQIVIDGFILPVLNQDGSVSMKTYHFFTSSAGQLRRDKTLFISDDAWSKVKDRIECGLSWDEINRRGGVNCNKHMAYSALCGSATDEWTDFDIDRAIVIPEFKGEVTDRMMYIKSDYSYEVTEKTVEIDHTDGCGMMLPSVSTNNFQFRGSYFKGLLVSFDFLRFCRDHNVPAVIKDVWGLEHDLIKEDIQILFTESTFKMWKYYDSWEDYKRIFKACGAKFGKLNYEEPDPDKIELAAMNYQMICNGSFTQKCVSNNVVNLYLQGVRKG